MKKNAADNLIIDVGNSFVKASVFRGDSSIGQFSGPTDTLENVISEAIGAHPQIKNIVTSSVGKPELDEIVSSFGLSVHKFTHDSKYPIHNKYATPKTVGIDRLILASGSVLAFPGQNRLVIDAGTCITYDFIDDKDVYYGGAISPGLRLRYKALNDYTARLPLLDREMPEDFVGNSTAASIHSGVVIGALGEIESFLERYRSRYPNFITILTGGDSEFLAERLKNTIFANPNFLLESLNQTYQFALND